MSKSTKLFETDWISVHKSEKGFIYCQRKSVNSIAALLYKKVDNEKLFLVHYQPLPEVEEKTKFDDCFPSTVTGAIEEGEKPVECVIREIQEETGFKVTKKHIKASSVSIATTQMNEKVFNFLVDVTNLEQGEIMNDGSLFEAVSYNEWKTAAELETIFERELYLSSLTSCYLLTKKI
ncbi:NUDIX domain [Mycoplasmopsis californica]|uniref:NUDIX hydrolase n=1 Tax=Mycoplasmopsis equigenitalium TaxID=114883 RepID=A0ABY5J3U8_9BACT|nr:NUDIX hydrolase [Mycoplasmopsis equigenitalium]UUD37196.1 NUDIX hydrolase [Mycoplasmopsis equigenitalium]VEU69500.1 NUDIX domain [Mycoplasmopsis californica]